MAVKNETKTKTAAANAPKQKQTRQVTTPAERAQRNLDKACNSYYSKKKIADKLQASADEAHKKVAELRAAVEGAAIAGRPYGIEAPELDAPEVHEVSEHNAEAEELFASDAPVED